MLDDEQPLAVTVTGRFEGWSRPAGGVNGSVTAAGAGLAEEAWLADADGLAEGAGLADADGLAEGAGLAEGTGLAGGGGRAAGRAGEGTLLPFYIDPMTKLF